jgi:hypothetical protein
VAQKGELIGLFSRIPEKPFGGSYVYLIKDGVYGTERNFYTGA